MGSINPQFIKTESGELVVLTRAEFDSLVARAADVGEDADDVAIFDIRMNELRAERDARLPSEVSGFVLQGDSLLKALRRWRDMTQATLAARADLTQGYVSDLESGHKAGTPDTIRRTATALEIDPRWLAPIDTDPTPRPGSEPPADLARLTPPRGSR